MNLALTSPYVLWLLPLVLLPLLGSVLSKRPYPSLVRVESDLVSRIAAHSLTAAGILAIGGLLLAIGGLHRKGQTIDKIGEGAHVVLLIDRSSSMDNTFAGRPPSGKELSKSAAARSFLKPFIEARAHDLFGIAAFSTSPIHVLPLTEHKDAILAAVDAMDRPGLAFTNVGRGLALSLDMHEKDPSRASRAIVLVSDGAAVIDRKVQEKLRTAFAKRPINLYWVFLRTEGTKGISYIPAADEMDTPQSLPERHLDIFFKSLSIPYRSFEAENPEAIAEAIGEIDRLERSPIAYVERIPQRDLSGVALSISLGSLLLLIAAKLAERSALIQREAVK